MSSLVLKTLDNQKQAAPKSGKQIRTHSCDLTHGMTWLLWEVHREPVNFSTGKGLSPISWMRVAGERDLQGISLLFGFLTPFQVIFLISLFYDNTKGPVT